MKQKFSFPGRLLPIRKQLDTHRHDTGKPVNRTNRRFALALLLLWLILYISTAKASAANDPGIPIGARVPDVQLKHLMNYPSLTANISDFKGKLLILDFWDTWCSGCLKSMPDIAALKSKFGSRVQFINVTPQSRDIVKTFLGRNNLIRNLNLTIAPEDKVCAELFPHKLVPHVVWISPSGIYLGATSQQDLTAENISHILATGQTTFSDPKADVLQFDARKPLFADGNGGTPATLFKSILTRYQPGLPSETGSGAYNGGQRFFATNTDLFELYCKALSLPLFAFSDNRIVYTDFAAKSFFKYHRGSDKASSLYCYELFYPDGQWDAAAKLMRAELDSWLGLHVTIETQLVRCYILSVNGALRLHSADTARKNNLRETGTGNRFIRGQWLQTLLDFLNSRDGMPPVLDEVHYNGRVDLDLNADPADIPELNKALRPYGLSLKETSRSLKMMIVSAAPQGAALINQP